VSIVSTMSMIQARVAPRTEEMGEVIPKVYPYQF